MSDATVANTGLTRSGQVVDTVHLTRPVALPPLACLDDGSTLLAHETTGSHEQNASVPYIRPESETRQGRTLGGDGSVVAPDGRQKHGPRLSAQWWAHWTMPIPETGCHIWMASVCKLGYGRLADFPVRGKTTLVHRAAYEHFVGPVPDGMKVCHRCDVPSCVNPDHLFLGTQKDNLQDMFRKRRARPRGRAFGWRDELAESA